jgi:hypothetical protein
VNILSIGNSFSRDAQRYLHRIARADGVVLNTYNLYIGGCPLSVHYRNMISEKKAYNMDVNGETIDFAFSLKETLLNRDWDVVTVQQASRKSPYYETYQPYLNKLVEYVRMCVPKAKIVVHQTWVYEQDSARLEELGYKNHVDMFIDVKEAYKKASEEIKADFIIPSGEVFQKLIASGIEKVHRDTFHASLGLGRYTLGLLWYKMLTGNDITNNTFCNFDEEVTESEIKTAKKCVEEICSI